ncbi:MAG: helix-turn-helix domain-containing protein [Mycobacteriales bacterium]
MEIAHVVRAARRARDLSQRELAALTGVSPGTIANLEAGRTQPRWDTAARLLAPLGLEPTLGRLAAPADDELRQWLRMSSTERLYRSLGGKLSGYSDRRHPVWLALVEAVAVGTVVLARDAALGVWLPEWRPALPLALHVLPPRYGMRAWPPSNDLVHVLPGPWSVQGLVAVGVSPWHDVLVPAPDAPDLAGDGLTAARLRTVAKLLHEEMRRDAAGRRTSAHTDSDPIREFGWLATRHRFDASKERPDPRKRRDWRLGGEASFREWLGLRGHETRDAPDL